MRSYLGTRDVKRRIKVKIGGLSLRSSETKKVKVGL